MFGLFKSVVVEDPQLGRLKRSGLVWEGTITLNGAEPVYLGVSGTKHAPFTHTIATASELKGQLPAMLGQVGPALFDHARPYQEALDNPEHGPQMRRQFDDPHVIERILAIATPEQALAEAKIEGVEVGSEGTETWVLIKFAVTWDEEHTVGAYFDDWRFTELNGSV